MNFRLHYAKLKLKDTTHKEHISLMLLKMLFKTEPMFVSDMFKPEFVRQ